MTTKSQTQLISQHQSEVTQPKQFLTAADTSMTSKAHALHSTWQFWYYQRPTFGQEEDG